MCSLNLLHLSKHSVSSRSGGRDGRSSQFNPSSHQFPPHCVLVEGRGQRTTNGRHLGSAIGVVPVVGAGKVPVQKAKSEAEVLVQKAKLDAMNDRRDNTGVLRLGFLVVGVGVGKVPVQKAKLEAEVPVQKAKLEAEVQVQTSEGVQGLCR